MNTAFVTPTVARCGQPTQTRGLELALPDGVAFTERDRGGPCYATHEGQRYLVGVMLFAFGVHAALWTIVGTSLRQRLTPPEMLGRVASTSLFIAAGGNCVGAVLGGVVAARFGITAPYWAGFVVAVLVSATTWRVFNRAAVAAAYAEPEPEPDPEPDPEPEPKPDPASASALSEAPR